MLNWFAESNTFFFVVELVVLLVVESFKEEPAPVVADRKGLSDLLYIAELVGELLMRDILFWIKKVG